MTTLTPDQLAQLLRQDAAGYSTTEAAAQLLCDHASWLRRSDFVAACIEYDHDGVAPAAWVHWDAVPAFVETAQCSSSEGHVLRLAAELAGVDTSQPLGQMLSGLDDRNSRIVADAIAHALRLGGRR